MPHLQTGSPLPMHLIPAGLPVLFLIRLPGGQGKKESGEEKRQGICSEQTGNRFHKEPDQQDGRCHESDLGCSPGLSPGAEEQEPGFVIGTSRFTDPLIIFLTDLR